jgi:hypothetical protein
MRYIEFRDDIRSALRASPRGLTWAQLRERLDLPYERPCPSWVQRLEAEIGLARAPGPARTLVWRVQSRVSRKHSRE